MKKTITFISICLSALFLAVRAFAAIQYPPKDTDITVSVPVTDTAPVIDGVISDGEYTRLDISDTSVSFVVGADKDWNRAKNTKFEAYGAVYDGSFFFALRADQPAAYYRTQCEPRMMWAQTCLLLSFGKNGTSGRTALELGIRPDGKSYVFNGYNGSVYSPDGTFAAIYENGSVLYEISVPLSSFGAENDPDFRFCFSISLGDYFDHERTVCVQFGKGISGFSEEDNAEAGKDVSIFPTVRIVGETSPITDTEDSGRIPSESPDTGVDVLPAVAVTLLSAVLSVCAVYSFQRKTVKRLR